MSSVETIRGILLEKLAATQVDITDESAQHAGHRQAPAPGEATHLYVRIVSPLFAGKTLLERHRLVHEAVGASFEDGLHALRLRTLAPGEPGAP